MKNKLIIVLCALFLTAARVYGVTMDEVIVTATQTEVEYYNVAQSVEVITEEEIKNSPYTTLREIIEMKSGVYIRDYGTRSATSNPVIRGGSRVLVLINGHRVNNMQSGAFDIAKVPLSYVEKVEIIKGASSALYGADAMDGVINIITKKPLKQEVIFRQHLSENKLRQTEFFYADRHKNTGWTLSSTLERDDGWRENSSLKLENFAGSVNYAKDNLALHLRSEYSHKKSGTPSTTKQPGDWGYASSVSFTDTPSTWHLANDTQSWNKEEDSLNQLRLTYKLKKGVLILKGGYNNYRHWYYDSGNDTISDHQNRNYTAGILWTGEMKNHRLSLGGDYNINHTKSPDLGADKKTVYIRSGYIQDEIQISKPLIFTAGVRYDNHKTATARWSPRASFNYFIFESNLRLKAAFGKAFKAPAPNDLYWADPFMTGNPNLKPERSTEFEGGLEKFWLNDKGEETMRVYANYFHKQIKDMIRWAPSDTSFWFWTPTNVLDAEISGVEAGFELSYKILNLSAQYTHLNPEYSKTQTVGFTTYNKGDKIDYEARDIITYSALLNMPRGIKFLNTGRYVRNFVPAGNEGRPYSQYFVSDFKISKRHKNMNFYTGVNNAFNKKYMPRRGYPAAPRAWFGGIEYSF